MTGVILKGQQSCGQLSALSTEFSFPEVPFPSPPPQLQEKRQQILSQMPVPVTTRLLPQWPKYVAFWRMGVLVVL